MYILGCETLGFESNAPVLSAGLLHFDLDKQYNFMELVNDVRVVKFKLKEQLETYNRVIDKNVLEYWKSSGEEAKLISFIPKKSDMSFIDGMERLRQFVDSNDIVLSRGFLSKNCINSLCKVSGSLFLFKNSQYAETSTMINCIKDTARNGYCPVEVPGLNRNILEHKIAHDAYMLLVGE